MILRFDGENVTSTPEIDAAGIGSCPDQTVRLGISRGGSEQELPYTIGKRDNSMDAFNLKGWKA